MTSGNVNARHCTITAIALRWIARIWGIASTLLLLAFAFGGREHLHLKFAEAIAFLFFPIGVIAGFIVAWRHELAGGLLTVGCFLVIVAWLFTSSGRSPGIYFLLFAAPGFIHIASFLLSRCARVDRRP